QRDATHGRGVYTPVVFVGPGGKGKESLQSQFEFVGSILRAAAGQAGQPLHQLIGAVRQVFGQIVQNLSTIEGGGLLPAGRLTRSSNGVANIFAATQGNVPGDLAFAVDDREAG